MLAFLLATWQWFIGTRVGRYLAAGLTIAAAVGGALLMARRSGRKAAEADRTEDRMDAIKDQKEIEDEVDSLDRDSLRDGLGDWVRDDR